MIAVIHHDPCFAGIHRRQRVKRHRSLSFEFPFFAGRRFMGSNTSIDMWGDTRTAVVLSTWRDWTLVNAEDTLHHQWRKIGHTILYSPKPIFATLGNKIPIMEKSRFEHNDK